MLWRTEWGKFHLVAGFDTALWKLNGGNPISLQVLTPRYGNRVGKIPFRWGFRHCAMKIERGKSHLITGSDTALQKHRVGESHLIAGSDIALWKIIVAFEWGIPHLRCVWIDVMLKGFLIY